MQNINKFTEVYIFVPSITIRRNLPYMESRVKEIDYLKCIFITLMIIFHLVYIGDKYPYAKQIVYTFHMSAFLIISGYLANNRKDARSFLRKFLWIFIPYACMEAAYKEGKPFGLCRQIAVGCQQQADGKPGDGDSCQSTPIQIGGKTA